MSEQITVPSRPPGLTEGSDRLAMEATRLATIATLTDADAAGQFLRGVRERVRRIKAHYKEARSGLDTAYDNLKAMETRDLAPWSQADVTVGASLLAWQVAETARVDAENRRIAAEDEARAREERDRQAQTLRDAAAAAGTKREQDALESQARRVEKTEPLVTRGTPAIEKPKIAGVSMPMRKVAEVRDPEKFLRAVLAKKIPRTAIVINQKFLDEQATRLGADLNYPGVVVVEKPHLSTRGL